MEQLEIERCVHHVYRNLVVAATGTGKTMVAAFDFLRLYKEILKTRLLGKV
ncbi:DEAD/DEAH box helicase family protein [Fusibacter bizertensis]|uniref:DEAD/DEAH box helicase family protein n=1 Tax=Fusibacter bizertensis TaxID=1488331 RepID=A0ABT6NEA0_9FIRM|nr:DEAD/DEAH box helicase family protein [Fusibacter bizertensis]MDH8678733.1 DEAD/DEAH box helicase family protein [Fusibacter bizertensis]